jgi:CHASE2 domain
MSPNDNVYQRLIARAKKALNEGRYQRASEILTKAEGHIDPEVPVLRKQLDQGIRRKVICNLLVVLGLTLLVQFLEFDGWLASAEFKIFDCLLAPPRSAEQGPILTVEIDDDAYADCFSKNSPLYPENVMSMLKVVNELAGPLVIGVDIMTEASAYKSEKVEDWSRVVWIAGGKVLDTPLVCFWDWMLGRPNPTTVVPGEVLGRDSDTIPGPRWGLPVFPADEDSKIRRVNQKVLTYKPPGDVRNRTAVDGWALTIASQYCTATKSCYVDGSRDEPVYIRYGASGPKAFHMKELFTCSKRGEKPPLIEENGERLAEFRSLATGRIVLIGGTFSSARDTYYTPKGQLPGLTVNAYAVQSAIDGSFWPEELRPVAILLDLAIGVGIMLIFRLRPPKHEITGAALRSRYLKRPINWLLACWRKHKFRGAVYMSTALVIATGLFVRWFPGAVYLPGFVGVVLGTMAHQIHGGVELEDE